MKFYINQQGIVFDENLNTFDEKSPIYPIYYQYLVDEKEFLHTDKQLIDVPNEVSNIQLRLALLQSGISVKDITESIKDNELAYNLWEYSNIMHRNNPLLNQMAIGLGLSKEQLDNIFILANTL